jgi:pSer/pThr/pTyr-binding forkhead associated (FHA) protein
VTGATFGLEAHNVIGRGTHCHLRLDDPRISNEQAALSWNNGGWHVRDLGSTNGTWLAGERLAPGVDVALGRDAELGLGGPSLDLRLVDAGPPEPMVTCLHNGAQSFGRDGLISIPDAVHPAAAIFRDLDGSWRLEQGDRVRLLSSGAVFEVEGDAWRFSTPTEWQPTIRTQRLRLLADSTFEFDVSKDEEQVSLTVGLAHERVRMGTQTGYYLLLTLARLRSSELAAGLNSDDAGWVHREELMKMLRCSEQQLNVWVHRVRSRFSVTGFLDYAAVIQRRDGSGQMRVGAPRWVFSR